MHCVATDKAKKSQESGGEINTERLIVFRPWKYNFMFYWSYRVHTAFVSISFKPTKIFYYPFFTKWLKPPVNILKNDF